MPVFQRARHEQVELGYFEPLPTPCQCEKRDYSPRSKDIVSGPGCGPAPSDLLPVGSTRNTTQTRLTRRWSRAA